MLFKMKVVTCEFIPADKPTFLESENWILHYENQSQENKYCFSKCF